MLSVYRCFRIAVTQIIFMGSVIFAFNFLEGFVGATTAMSLFI